MDVDAFEEHRPLLLGLAYRLLGGMWDAEDIVQEAFLRWTRATEVREPRAYLITIVSRLALDQLRSARVTREAYPGPWLPEPVPSGAFGPQETAELTDTLSYATLHMMERLSPPERAVFVLREAFELPYERIAGILDVPAATCRQHHRRAAARLAEGRDRFHPTAADHTELLGRFLDAARGGDLTTLTDLLAEDVVAWNDGGGRTRAALHPIQGRDRVAAFIAGLGSRYGLGAASIVEANGAPAVWTHIDGQEQLAMFDIRNGRIHTIYAVLNRDKLAHVHRPRPA